MKEPEIPQSAVDFLKFLVAAEVSQDTINLYIDTIRDAWVAGGKHSIDMLREGWSVNMETMLEAWAKSQRKP